ncbi:MAG: MoaD/ThiS family protein [Bdellovibrionota bacterium]
MQVKVRYFAQLRELASKDEEDVVVEPNETPKSLYYSLSEKYHFPLGFEYIRVAINDEFAGNDSVLTNGDQVVFIPPVAGG